MTVSTPAAMKIGGVLYTSARPCRKSYAEVLTFADRPIGIGKQ
jgi:hypothetical protein